MRILHVVGARPNFIKVAPLYRAFAEYPSVLSKIVHTGQHYDAHMSDIFFSQLEMPAPDYCLAVGKCSPASQIAKIMMEFDETISREKPDIVMVVGDVNSTLACALAAQRSGVAVAHVEAGLRSGDRSMQEEVNRIVTDQISDELFVTEQAGVDNLIKENISADRIHLVGNIMIDSLVASRDKASKSDFCRNAGLLAQPFALMTFHRAANVDCESGLLRIIELIKQLTMRLRVVFPLHPRTAARLADFNLLHALQSLKGLTLLEPQGYLEFLHLMEHASLVLTDSGGVQEETTYLEVPCITLRQSTERPVTVEVGSNHLIKDMNVEECCGLVDQILSGKVKKAGIPDLWDGHTAKRIAKIIFEKYGS